MTLRGFGGGGGGVETSLTVFNGFGLIGSLEEIGRGLGGLDGF